MAAESWAPRESSASTRTPASRWRVGHDASWEPSRRVSPARQCAACRPQRFGEDEPRHRELDVVLGRLHQLQGALAVDDRTLGLTDFFETVGGADQCQPDIEAVGRLLLEDRECALVIRKRALVVLAAVRADGEGVQRERDVAVVGAVDVLEDAQRALVARARPSSLRTPPGPRQGRLAIVRQRFRLRLSS